MVEAQKDLSAGLLVILLICGICPGIIYYLAMKKTCPMCKGQNWGVRPESEPTYQDKLKYCPHCGSQVEGIFCANCGQKVI
jgi:hypothetical protein